MEKKKELGFPQTVQLGKYRISRHCLSLGGVGKRKKKKKKKKKETNEVCKEGEKNNRNPARKSGNLSFLVSLMEIK